jgi:hypothetical protein
MGVFYEGEPIPDFPEPTEPPLKVTVLKPGKVICCASAGAEEEVVALLATLGALTSHTPTITFEDADGPQEIAQSELSMAVGDDPFDYNAFLRSKAEGLIDVRIFQLTLAPNSEKEISEQ